MERNDELTVYYNHACPVCRLEMNKYREEAERDGGPVCFVDISDDANADALADKGISQDMAFRRIYAVDSKGEVVVGADTMTAIWRRLPRRQRLARISAHRWIRPLARWTYDNILAAAIYRWNQRRLKTAKLRHQILNHEGEA